MSSAGSKPASPSVVVVLGHSIANGVGATDPTYGGASVGSITFRDGGTTRATWPSNAGTGPDPGVLPYLAAHLAPGSTLIRRATNGQILAGVESTELVGAVADCVALGIDRALVTMVVLMIGENDAQDVTEATAYAARIAQTFDLVERAFPNARVVKQEMVTEGVSYAEFGTIRAADLVAVAARSTRVLSPRTGITLHDAVHYDLAGYAVAAAAQWAAWGTAS